MLTSAVKLLFKDFMLEHWRDVGKNWN